MDFFTKGSSRAYSLTVAATIFAFLTASSTSLLLPVASVLSGPGFWLQMIGGLFAFVAAVIFAVVASPYGFAAGYRKSLSVGATVCAVVATGCFIASTVLVAESGNRIPNP